MLYPGEVHMAPKRKPVSEETTPKVTIHDTVTLHTRRQTAEGLKREMLKKRQGPKKRESA